MYTYSQYSLHIEIFSYDANADECYINMIYQNALRSRIHLFKDSLRRKPFDDSYEITQSFLINKKTSIFGSFEDYRFQLTIIPGKISMRILNPIKIKRSTFSDYNKIDFAFYIELLLQLTEGFAIWELYTEQQDY